MDLRLCIVLFSPSNVTVSLQRYCEFDFKVLLGYKTPCSIWVPHNLVGLCWKWALPPLVSSLAARVMFPKHRSCQVIPYKLPLALEIKSQVIAESFLGAPPALQSISLCLRHLGLPSVLQTGQAHSYSGGFWTCCLSAGSTLSVPGEPSPSLGFTQMSASQGDLP